MKNRLECMQPIRFLVVLLMCCLSYTTWAQTQSNGGFYQFHFLFLA